MRVATRSAGMALTMRDRTLEMLRQGYPWAARLRRGADAAATRLLGRQAVVIAGPAAVRRFYDPRLRRRGAFPPPIKLVLFGPGAVHGLDDADHHHRKALFLQVLTPESVTALARRAQQEWASATAHWAGREVVVFDEAVQVLTASVLPWAGVPVTREEVPLRGRQLAAVVDGFAKPGPAYVRAVTARWKLDRWARRLVHQTRQGQVQSPPGTALHAVAHARTRRGSPLPERIAAVELLNIVRPTVAVAWFVAFAAKALHEHPQWQNRIAAGDDAALDAFVQEVRRLYPFTPWLAARARDRQDVLGVPVRRGALVVLDVYGTLHDETEWSDPDRFDPERFLHGGINGDALVPQGGGEVSTGHRCPGEGVALTMLAVAVRALASLPHTLPTQDLGYDLTQMPTLPRSGVVLAAGNPQQHRPTP